MYLSGSNKEAVKIPILTVAYCILSQGFVVLKKIESSCLAITPDGNDLRCQWTV